MALPNHNLRLVIAMILLTDRVSSEEQDVFSGIEHDLLFSYEQ